MLRRLTEFQHGQCGHCGKWTGFTARTSVFLVSIISSALHTHSFIASAI